MLKIRLARTGRRNQPSYRLVVTEARSKRNGQYLEGIGFWNPQTNELKIDKKRYQYWLKHGAQPTNTAKKLYEKTA